MIQTIRNAKATVYGVFATVPWTGSYWMMFAHVVLSRVPFKKLKIGSLEHVS